MKKTDRQTRFANFILSLSISIGWFFLLFPALILPFLRMEIDFKEHVTFEPFHIGWILYGLLFCFLIFYFLRLQARIRPKVFFFLCALVYLVFGTILILSIDSKLRADAGFIFKAAWDYLTVGNTAAFSPKGYFGIYPHQISLFFYEYAVLSLTKHVEALFFINLLLVIAINWLLYRITESFTNKLPIENKKLPCLLVILLSFAFLPQFFFLTFVYGTIVGLFFLLLGYRLFLSFQEKERLLYLPPALLCLVLSCLLRNNFIIAILAIALDYFIRKKKLLYAMLFLLAFLSLQALAKTGLNACAESISGFPVAEGAPKTLWIAMGTQPDNVSLREAGWYNGYNKKIFTENHYDSEKSNEIAKKEIKKNLTYWAGHPGQSLLFFGRKFLSTWLDPSFQSIWTGPNPHYGQVNRLSWADSLYHKGKLYHISMDAMQAILVLLYLLAFLGLVDKRIPKRDHAFSILFFIGGVLFHLMWETKSQYVYPYILLLIPLAASKLSLLTSSFQNIQT